jgi:5-formyltetrahydrofolate cyclo-ligase
MDKKEIRKEIISKRNSVDMTIRQNWDKAIFQNLVNSNFYNDAKSIFIFISYGSEVDTIRIIEHSLKIGKEVYVPKTYKDIREMKAVRITNLMNMTKDKMGILEPVEVNEDSIGENFDLIIMPGVVFDSFGNRIGYGGGYYDKYLSNYKEKTEKIALAYHMQLLNKIETENHDIKVDYIITEKNIIKA